MKEKQVTLIRKQNTPFTVNFPIDGRVKTYIWRGTVGKKLDEKAVPFEVYDWLANYTTTFTQGVLIIKETEDEEVLEIKENIDDIEKVEKSVLTKEEVVEILTKGNHNALKSKLEELVKDQSEETAFNQKRYIVSVASEIGLDSSAKRKAICEWAGLEFENSDLIFDKELKETYNEK